MVFLYFRTLSAIFEFYMASQKPRRHLKPFLEPVAPFSQSLGPFRGMATSFIPNMTTLGMSVCCPEQYISRKQTPPPFLTIYRPSKFVDPSQVLRNALVYRKFVIRCFSIVWLTNYRDFRRETLPNDRFQGWALWGYIARTIYFQNNVFSEQRPFPGTRY